jgi:hypothetical protein
MFVLKTFKQCCKLLSQIHMRNILRFEHMCTKHCKLCYKVRSIAFHSLIDVSGKYYCFYNAVQCLAEQSGFATSANLINRTRYPDNSVIRNNPVWYESYRMTPFWRLILTYSGVPIISSFSTLEVVLQPCTSYLPDLMTWSIEPCLSNDNEPLCKSESHPDGLNHNAAHKLALVSISKHFTYPIAPLELKADVLHC